MLFDAHTHLNFEKYTDEERKALAEEIEASELGYIIDVADCGASALQALQDADDYPWCYAAVGVHPDHASVYTDADIDLVRRLAQSHPKAVAIGEIGLDFYYGKEDHAEQEELFRKQIRLANELRLPIMIHSRDAHKLTMDILVEEGAFSEERKSWFPPRPAPQAYAQKHCVIEGSENPNAQAGDVVNASKSGRATPADHPDKASQNNETCAAVNASRNSLSDIDSKDRPESMPGTDMTGFASDMTGSAPAVAGFAPEMSGSAPGVAGSVLEKSGFASDMTGSAPAVAGFAPDARVQLHCFSGSPELAEEYVRLGATISLGGPITFKNGRKAAEVVQRIPIEFLLSETDAPYMAPEPLRGRPNKPQYVEHVVRRMAMIKGISYKEAAYILTENGKRFFGIDY